jgi:hypothetical protein
VLAALRAAVKLGVFDAFTNPDLPLGVDQIAIATGVLDMQYLYRLLRYLCQYELFLELDGQGFALMELGQYMRSAHPSGLCYAAVSFGEPAHYIPWMHLEQAVKQGEAGQTLRLMLLLQALHPNGLLHSNTLCAGQELRLCCNLSD